MASRNNNQSWFWRMWSESKVFQALVFLIPAAIIFFYVRKVKEDKRKINKKRDVRALADQLMQSNPTLSQDEADARAVELMVLAEQISKAFWSFQTFAWGSIVTWRLGEDEDAAISAINQCADSTEVAALCDEYYKYNDQYSTATITSGKKGLSLLADCKSFLNSSEWNRIHSFIRNSLK